MKTESRMGKPQITFRVVSMLCRQNGIKIERTGRKIQVWKEDHSVAECSTVAEAYAEVYWMIRQN